MRSNLRCGLTLLRRRMSQWNSALEKIQIDGSIHMSDVRLAVEERGLLSNDLSILKTLNCQETWTSDEFISQIKLEPEDQQEKLKRALSDKLKLRNWPAFKETVETFYNEVKTLQFKNVCETPDPETGEELITGILVDKAGQELPCWIPTYIPQLGSVDRSLFAVSICTVDGQKLSFGDADALYTMQSTSKPYTYAFVHEHMDDELHKYVGHEPSGRKFNKVFLDRYGRPHNPMINMGAIMTASLPHPQKPLSTRFNYFLENYKKLINGVNISCNMPVYKSELEVGFKNKCAVNYMMDRNCWRGLIHSNHQMDENLDLYYQLCSLELNTQMQTEMSACLANRGVHPISGKQVLPPRSVKKALTLMFSSGMYDYSGIFAFRYGVPAKSGVSGVTTVVFPGVLAMTIYSPWLGLESSSSILGMEFIDRFVKKYPNHVFDTKDHFGTVH